MIIDSNLVLIDHLTKNELAEGAKSRAVPLTSFLEPGRQGPIPIVVQLSDGLVSGETITFKLYQGDEYADAETEGSSSSSSEGGWEEIGTFTASGPMKKGCRIGWRFLPRSVTKQWLRLSISDNAGGSHKATDLNVFAAIVREDLFEYDKLLYINAGRNEWEAKEAALNSTQE